MDKIELAVSAFDRLQCPAYSQWNVGESPSSDAAVKWKKEFS